MGGRHGDLAAAGPYLSTRREWSEARSRGRRAVSVGSALEGPCPILRVLPRRQRRGDRCEPSDRLDRLGGQTDPTERRIRGRNRELTLDSGGHVCMQPMRHEFRHAREPGIQTLEAPSYARNIVASTTVLAQLLLLAGPLMASEPGWFLAGLY